MVMRKLLPLLLTIVVAFVGGCNTDADIASTNLSKAAEQFEIVRRIVFVNGITDTYILQVEGRCSVEFHTAKFEVTCKVTDKDGTDEYVKHYLGRADNVFPFVEQLRGAQVSASRYKVIFKPLQIIPDIDLVK
jgi:hypothetical protein